jgi:protoheme ferro-lyase
MNRTPPQLKEPNYYTYYKTQDTTPTGKIAIFISGLFMPENFRMQDFHNLALKPTQYIPWPFRARAFADNGVLLLDAEKFYEFEAFTPTRLIDAHGSDIDIDGVPYVVKYHRGEVKWVPPAPNRHMDHGYFLYQGRKGGMPTQAAKLITKARVYYYAPGKGFMDGRVPHEAGQWAIAKGALEKMRAKYGDIPYRFVSTEDEGRARQMMHELLHGGADTIILGHSGAIYSHHEEFNGSIKHAMHDIHEWEQKHNKKIKVIITPQIGEFPVARQAHLQLLKDRLDTLPAQASVKVVVSIHGMAWDTVPHEAWLELAPPYRDAMVEDAKAMVAGYGFSKTEVVLAQDHFADHFSDPKGRYLSTNKAFMDGIKAGYDYVINVPIEFFAENTDTMFSHAMFNFEGFPGYSRYEPVDYPDWSVPYTRTFKIENTTVIYNGLPVGRYNAPLIEAYAQAIDSVLSKGAAKVAQN